jgi:hypothetical protein
MTSHGNLETKLQNALRHALGQPALPLQAVGGKSPQPGLFPGGKPGKELAEEALRRGYVAAVDGAAAPPGKGKAKPKSLYRVSEAGQRFVLEADSPKAVLESLLPVLRDLAGRVPNATADGQRQSWTQAAAQVQQTLEEQFRLLRQTVQEALEQARDVVAGQFQSLGRLSQLMDLVQGAVERAGRETPAPAVSPPAPSSGAPPNASWTGEVVPFIRERRAHGGTDECPLHEIFNYLKQRQPGLTVGNFQDGMRQLHNAQQIRLSGWNRPLEDIPEPNLALFVAHKVMYYARIPQPA